MIRLGLRLTLNGGREAAVRLVLTAAAVALGVCLLLITLAGINAVNTQNARYAWLATSAASAPPGPGSQPLGGRPTGRDPLWWQLRADHYGGQLIGRVDVAATGPDSPVPPGLPRLPGPGEFYASPALSRLLHTTPAAQLGDRFAGHQIGTIGAAGAARPKLADHRRRPHPRPALPRARRPEGDQYPDDPAQQLPRQQLRRRGGHQRQRHRPDPLRGGRGAAVPGADLHRPRRPGCPPRAGSSGSRPCGWPAPRPGRWR